MSLPVLFSYIDPMSGTILLQLVIGALIGGVAFFHRSIRRVFRLVVRWKSSDKGSSEEKPLA